jgi:biuret amidohydrolase
MPRFQVAADPYPWPMEDLAPAEAALVVVDMQRDFCDPDGYVGTLGADIDALRAPIAPIRRCLDAARRAGLAVVYTRQGYRPDLADMPAWQREKRRISGGIVGRQGPLGRILVRGEPGFQVIDELAPAPGDIVVDKTANGAFTGTDMDTVLRAAGIRALAFAGNTIDVCVHTSLREANDRGYQCLLIADACGALEPELHEWSVRSVKVEGGVFGSVTDADGFARGLA